MNSSGAGRIKQSLVLSHPSVFAIAARDGRLSWLVASWGAVLLCSQETWIIAIVYVLSSSGATE